MKQSLLKKTKFMSCTTFYYTYSGAVSNEKMTWGQFDADTSKFIIESEATIPENVPIFRPAGRSSFKLMPYMIFSS